MAVGLKLTDQAATLQRVSEERDRETKRANANAAIYAETEQRMRSSALHVLTLVEGYQREEQRADQAEADLQRLTEGQQRLRAQIAKLLSPVIRVIAHGGFMVLEGVEGEAETVPRPDVHTHSKCGWCKGQWAADRVGGELHEEWCLWPVVQAERDSHAPQVAIEPYQPVIDPAESQL